MSNDTHTLDATCLCGMAKHQITLPLSAFPLPFQACHCSSCRHTTGTLTVAVAFLPEVYQPAQDLLERLVPFQFSERLTHYHCKTCGTKMLCHCWRDAEDHSKGSSWDVATGTLDKIDEHFEIEGHLHVADTLDGGFADFLTTYNGGPVARWPHHFGKGEQLPARWEHPDRPMITPKQDDRLHAHCKCGGVQFWIARPSERSRQAEGKWPDLLIPHYSCQRGPEGSPWWIVDEGKKYLAGLCTCDSCRLHTGMEWVEWAFVPALDITLDEAGQVPFSRDFGTLKGYGSSEGVTRYHCDRCGATAFYFVDDRPHIMDVAVGLLDAAEGARAESWLEFRCNRVSYREDAIPRAEGLTLAVETSMKEHGRWKYPHQSGLE